MRGQTPLEQVLIWNEQALLMQEDNLRKNRAQFTLVDATKFVGVLQVQLQIPIPSDRHAVFFSLVRVFDCCVCVSVQWKVHLEVQERSGKRNVPNETLIPYSSFSQYCSALSGVYRWELAWRAGN